MAGSGDNGFITPQMCLLGKSKEDVSSTSKHQQCLSSYGRILPTKYHLQQQQYDSMKVQE